jgi:DNA-binding NarL/FixJ family response regulator
MGTDQTIRCRFVSKWFKIDSYVYTKEGLFSEIEKNKPDVVVMDLDLYERMDGIETSRRINCEKVKCQYFIIVPYISLVNLLNFSQILLLAYSIHRHSEHGREMHFFYPSPSLSDNT